DILRIYIKVKDNRIEEIKFKTFGCAAAIASGSVLTEMAKGKTIEEALDIKREEIIKELGGLPSQKRHCSVLAQDALKKAVDNYKRRRSGVLTVRFSIEGKGDLIGELYKTALGKKVIESLPLNAKISLWGKELYFPTGVKAELTQPQVRMDAGDIAFWPEEGALCLFWGATPISNGMEILAYSAVEVVGNFKVDEKLLDSLEDGDNIRVVRVDS
ncbi:MAG: iron-sulfur cluster assembly scaffold protein, partial [Planctomycetota bacterium]|nr:iron-sulfur cluster assembly scaffold protein [Planctomycetota bacterium]